MTNGQIGMSLDKFPGRGIEVSADSGKERFVGMTTGTATASNPHASKARVGISEKLLGLFDFANLTPNKLCDSSQQSAMCNRPKRKCQSRIQNSLDGGRKHSSRSSIAGGPLLLVGWSILKEILIVLFEIIIEDIIAFRHCLIHRRIHSHVSFGNIRIVAKIMIRVLLVVRTITVRLSMLLLLFMTQSRLLMKPRHDPTGGQQTQQSCHHARGPFESQQCNEHSPQGGLSQAHEERPSPQKHNAPLKEEDSRDDAVKTDPSEGSTENIQDGRGQGLKKGLPGTARLTSSPTTKEVYIADRVPNRNGSANAGLGAGVENDQSEYHIDENGNGSGEDESGSQYVAGVVTVTVRGSEVEGAAEQEGRDSGPDEGVQCGGGEWVNGQRGWFVVPFPVENGPEE